MNKKVIVICGFARGGTNILWNILQSHPEICTPITETGKVFKGSWPLNGIRLFHSTFPNCFTSLQNHLIDKILFSRKMLTLNHPDNMYKSENELYTEREVKNSALCLKGINDDIYLTDILLNVYPDLFFIGLTRNGFSLCEGYARRGFEIKKTADIYTTISNQMQKYQKRINNFCIVKFEDVLNTPFQVAEELFAFLDMPYSPKKLRLKSKKRITMHGTHDVSYGQENRKYWFSKESIYNMLNKNQSDVQRERLSDTDYHLFRSRALNALQFFGYE